MQNEFKVTVVKQYAHNHARVVKISTPHGELLSPVFMPVGTRAVVNFISPADLLAVGSQIILGGNTYHMLCNPGMEIIRAAQGMHKFMGWHQPMLTDSGGFQVLSLAKLSACRVDEQGAHFKHPHTGQVIHLTPASSLATQKIIGADIIMAFDQCTPDLDDQKMISTAMQRTHRWLQESVACHQANPFSAYGKQQALFGIIQGGNDKNLRQQSAAVVAAAKVDGIAIGGETIGFNMPKTLEVIEWVRPWLLSAKPRYTMGVGMGPQDLINVVAAGIDMFDCVAPTRNARHGALYCGKLVQQGHWLAFESEYPHARINIKKSVYAKDTGPIMDDCDCSTCRQFTRAYLHFLFKQGAAAYSNLACIHNLAVMHRVCTVMREQILSS